MSTIKREFYIELTDDEVIDGLKSLAQASPNFVYKTEDDVDGSGGCTYFHGTEPGCIVGHLLARHGVQSFDLGFNNGAAVQQLINEGMLRVSHRASKILNEVQRRQDSGTTWGTSVQEALIVEAVPCDVS